MIRYLLALIAVIFATPALAMPALDAAAHPYVQLVSTDKAVYTPSPSGNILVTLRNPTGSSFAASVVTSVYLNTALVGPVTSSSPAADSRSVAIPAGGTLQVAIPFTIANTGERGYRVDVTVKNSGGTVVDDAPGAIDVQTSVINSRFPRQCWISHWDSSINAVTLIASQVAWHCNAFQGYALYYRPELAPDPSLSHWPSLSNLDVQRSTITSVLAAAHAANMPGGFFQATGEAYSDWLLQPIKPLLEWGSFDTTCGLTKSCTEANLNRSPTAPDNWTKYGWRADHIDFFDPCSAGWQQFLIAHSIRPMFAQLGFDFWQADTVGAPSGPGGITFNISGVPLNTAACLGDFTTGAATRLGKPTILNNVSGWGFVDTAFAGGQLYLYRETWDFDTPYLPGLNALISGSQFGKDRYSSRAIVQPAYLQRTLADGCSAGTITTGCTVNPNSPLLATAMFSIAGSTLMNHMDDGCMMTNVFVEGEHLPCASLVVDSLLAYKAFEVGYENLFRDGVSDSIEPCNITSGATGGTTGAAGQVYVLGKNKAGFQICHLLNLTGVSSNDWTDLNGTKEKPTALTNIGLKMYYYGNTVVSGTNKLWWASPDANQGGAQSLSYTTGSDSGGNFVTFTVPSLSYWDVIALETSLIDTNLSIDARQPIRGNWYGMASAGVAASGTYVFAGCCMRWADYRQVQFGTTAVTTANILYTAPQASTINLRLDSSTGAIIGRCALPAVSSLTTATCAVSPTTGLHDLFVEFVQPINLYGMFFS